MEEFSSMPREFFKKIIILSLIFSLIIFNPLSISKASTQSPKTVEEENRFSFNSYVELEYDSNILNKELNLEQSVAMPITITYWTDIPNHIFKFIPPSVQNIFLFNQPTKPFHTIELSIENDPFWVDISFSSSKLIIPIPLDSSKVKAETVLYITPSKQAPAESYLIELKTSCEPIGKLNGFTYYESLFFTPKFVPLIDISTENQILNVTPNEPQNINITVTNLGNKKARITPIILNKRPEWSSVINPHQIELEQLESTNFMFSIYPPYDFKGYNTFQLVFEVEVIPLEQDSPTQSYPINFIFYHSDQIKG